MLPAPLPIMIIEILKKRRNSIRDKELYNELVKLIGHEISEKDFNRALMILEIRKMIYVETIKKDLRLIHPLNI